MATQFRVLRDRGTQIFRPDVPISYLAWHAAGGRQTCPAGTVAALKNRMLAQSVLDFQFDAGPKHVAQIQPRRGSTQQILCDFINEKGPSNAISTLQSLTVAPNSIALPPGGLADVISRRELENVRGKLIDALRSEGLL